MDHRDAVECREQEVHFPVDLPYHAGHGECQRAVPEPIACRRQADRFDADLRREDLGAVGPRCGTPGHGEGADEEVGACDDALCDSWIVADDPSDGVEGRIGAWVWVAVDGGEGTRDEEEDHHEEGANEQRRAAAPFIEE